MEQANPPQRAIVMPLKESIITILCWVKTTLADVMAGHGAHVRRLNRLADCSLNTITLYYTV